MDSKNSYEQYKAKRDTWKWRFSGKKNLKAITRQLVWLTRQAAAYEILNEARRYGEPDPEGGVKLCGMLHRSYDSWFFSCQAVAIRRLVGRSKCDNSLWQLLHDMWKSAKLMTRENIFKYENLEYDPETARKKIHEELRDKPNNVGFTSPGYSDCEPRHSFMDKLCKVKRERRVSTDHIPKVIFKTLQDRITKGTEKVTTYANDWITHAGWDPNIEPEEVPNNAVSGISLQDLLDAHKLLCQVADFIGGYLVDRTARSWFPVFSEGPLRYIEKPLATKPAKQKLHDVWRTFADETRQWKWDWALLEK